MFLQMPLFLVACDTAQLPLAGLVRMVAVPAAAAEEEDGGDGSERDAPPDGYFSLRTVLRQPGALMLLRRAVLECCKASGSALDSVDLEVAAIAYSVAATSTTEAVDATDMAVIARLRAACEDGLRVAAQLYTSPYLQVGAQRHAARFLRAVAGIVDLGSPALPFPLQGALVAIAADVASYLASLVGASLAAAARAEAEVLAGAAASSAPPPPSSSALLLLPSVRALVDACTTLGALSVVACASGAGEGVLNATAAALCALAAHLREAEGRPAAASLGGAAAASVLRLLARAVHAHGAPAAAAQQLGVAIQQLLATLLAAKEPVPSRFRALVNALHCDGSGGEGGSTSKPNALLNNLVRSVVNGQYGKLSALFVGSRWSSVRACLEMRICLLGPSPEPGPSGTAGALLSLVLDQLEVCTMEAFPDIVACAGAVVRQLPTPAVAAHAATVERLVDVAWTTAEGGASGTDVAAINAFIGLAFDAALLRALDHAAVVRRHLDTVQAFALNNRPHVMQALVCHLCAVWAVDPALSLPFFRDGTVERLVLYRESRQDDTHCAGGDDAVVRGDGTSPATLAGIVRFAVLSFVEGVATAASPPPEVAACVSALAAALAALNLHRDFVVPAMIGSEPYGKKLRCWQALCVLAPFLSRDELQRGPLLDTYFKTLTHANGHSIRVHLELFGGALALRHPDVVLPRVLRLLTENFDHSQHMLCSLFVVLGHLVLEPLDVGGQRRPLDAASAQAVVDAMLPWLTCAQGLPRTVAQLVAVELIPVVATPASPQPHLDGIYRYLTTNRDAVKIMPKQRLLFKDCNPREHCTVAGLCALGVDNMGEVMPPHILTLIADFLKAEMKAQREDEERALPTALEAAAVAQEEGGGLPSSAIVLQTKRVPFDDLGLGIQNELASRKENAAGRRRQQVVVCASLIDKVANLAGIARTCEIFAVERLVLANLTVCATDTFQGIAVSCTEWLPMAEVTEPDLPQWLGSMRRQGYRVVGLEQTDASVSLADVVGNAHEAVTHAFTKCVLLLGKEREGIPVELLQEVDICLEIPQYGVIRSLNVHVSAAIALWEMTKRNRPT